jgi:hypothetical protein
MIANPITAYIRYFIYSSPTTSLTISNKMDLTFEVLHPFYLFSERTTDARND